MSVSVNNVAPNYLTPTLQVYDSGNIQVNKVAPANITAIDNQFFGIGSLTWEIANSGVVTFNTVGGQAVSFFQGGANTMFFDGVQVLQDPQLNAVMNTFGLTLGFPATKSDIDVNALTLTLANLQEVAKRVNALIYALHINSGGHGIIRN